MLQQISAPAFLDELTDENKAKWSELLANSIDKDIGEYQLTQFFNPLKKEIAADRQIKTIAWTAFPKELSVSSPSDRTRWRRADSSRHVQDEYCEWSIQRNDEGKISKVIFTSEGPEYWSFLARHQPDTVLKLYQTHISPQVKHQDLFDADGYKLINRWNESSSGDGIMHLIHRNNTLGAFINIGGRSTLIRKIDGRILTGEQELIRCGRYGGANRHSDPHIGGEVNTLARAAADITMNDPMGLYIHGLNTSGWRTPDDSDPLDYWKITRGTEKHGLRAVYEVPEDKGFCVGDITINSRNIEFGGQIADFIQIKLEGLACRIGQMSAEPVLHCHGEAGVVQAERDMTLSDGETLEEHFNVRE